jgi:HSP20 family protein
MDRLFDETVGQPAAAFSGLAAAAIDPYQSAEKVVVQASLPGADPKEIHLSVTGDILTLRLEVREAQDVEGAQYHGKEHRLDGLTRSIGLPAAVLADKADPQFEHGRRTMKPPMAQEVKPKTINERAR